MGAAAGSATACEPALLQPLQQAGFDLGGDVGVGLLNPVPEDCDPGVGLGRPRGDTVGDHPGLVTVTQTVEGQPGLGRVQPDHRAGLVEGAVDSRVEGAAAEVAAPVHLAVWGDEHEPAGVRAQMRAQQLDQERGQRDGARGLGRLRRRELDAPAGFDDRSDVRVDDDVAAVKVVDVCVVALQPGQFTRSGRRSIPR
jgi:hypothetical protein